MTGWHKEDFVLSIVVQTAMAGMAFGIGYFEWWILGVYLSGIAHYAATAFAFGLTIIFVLAMTP